jgi:hypothetical protein
MNRRLPVGALVVGVLGVRLLVLLVNRDGCTGATLRSGYEARGARSS